MTTKQNELIRYPVSVMPCIRPNNVFDSNGKYLCNCTTDEVAAELIRVVNAYHEIMQWKGGYFAEKLISQPAPAAASGDPSEAAMRAARMWFESGAEVTDGELARIIDTAFAAERAEAAERIEILESKLSESEFFVDAKDFNALEDKLTAAERERDEARAELANERKLADGYLTRNKIHQLRADLDEAVGLLGNGGTNFHEWFAKKITFLARLSKPSEPGNCSEVPNSSQAAPPGPATESGEEEVHRHIAKNDAIYDLRQQLAERDEKIKLMQVSWKHYEEQHTNQLAERDAEIKRLNSVLAGVQQIIHSSSAPDVV